MAICAACGVDIRKGEACSLLDCYVVHRHCLSTRRREDFWVELENERRIQRARIAAADAARAPREAQLRALENSISRLERELDTARARVKVQDAYLERAHHERLTLKAQLDTATIRLDTATERLAAAPAPKGLLDREIAAAAVGVSVSRGVWGMATYFSQRMRPEDDAAARYALLEL